MTTARLLAFASLVLSLGACGPSVETRFVPVGHASGTPLAQLETRIVRPDGHGPFPVALLLHGASGGHPAYTDPWQDEIAFLNARGYAVVAPMRRGRGRSSGVSAEYETRHCEPGAWDAGLADAHADLDAVLRDAATLPDLDTSRLTLWGVSRGGFLAVHYAATGRHRQAVERVVNFVGGWVAQAEDRCPEDFNRIAFGALGAHPLPPMLWLYGERDAYYGADAPAAYLAAFTAAGGHARFRLVTDLPGNGHELPRHPDRWRADVARFLDQGESGP